MSQHSLKEWPSEFAKLGVVQPADMQRGQAGGYLSSESAIICVGPARLPSDKQLGTLVPVGMVQSFQISQSRANQQIWEIGGRTPFNVPGRNNIRGALSRILFDGPSLAYAMYASELTNDGNYKVPVAKEFGGSISGNTSKLGPYNEPTAPYNIEGEAGTTGLTMGEVVSLEGKKDDNPGKLWLNMASALFNKPFGLGIVLYDMQGQVYGVSYLEDCLIQSHTMGIQANQTVLAENIQFTASRIKPLPATSLQDVTPTV